MRCHANAKALEKFALVSLMRLEGEYGNRGCSAREDASAEASRFSSSARGRSSTALTVVQHQQFCIITVNVNVN